MNKGKAKESDLFVAAVCVRLVCCWFCVCVCRVLVLFCFVFLPLFFQYCFQFARFHVLVWGKRSLNVLRLEISNSLTMLVTSFGSVL